MSSLSMTSLLEHGGDASMSLEGEEENLPRIDACFLIRFDKRIGYEIAWSRARDGCEHRVLVITCNSKNGGIDCLLSEP